MGEMLCGAAHGKFTEKRDKSLALGLMLASIFGVSHLSPLSVRGKV